MRGRSRHAQIRIGGFTITGPIHCLAGSFQNSGNRVKLHGSVVRQARGVRGHIHFRAPPADGIAYGNWVFDSTLGRFAGCSHDDGIAAKLKERVAALDEKRRRVLNGRYWLKDVEHFCYDESTGQLCCESAEDTIKKISIVFMEVAELVCDREALTTSHRMWKLVESAKPWAFGCRCHAFLQASLRRMCPLTAEDGYSQSQTD